MSAMELMDGIGSYRNSLTLSLDQSMIVDTLDSPWMQKIDDVKIEPGKMIFTDAFDGKHFKKDITIINCGKYPAFVRILPPTSQAFKMKPLRRGKYLPSGLSVTRTIKYTHTSATALLQACMFIYINEKPITYQIEVHLISTYVVLYPKILNFGEIDVGNASQQMTIELRNIGHRVAQFSIDLGRNDLELIVDPMKGSILPDEVIEVTVEVLGSHTGQFQTELWVKTEPPRRVKLTGVFIAPKVALRYPPSTNFNLTLLDFPTTYYGAKSVRTIIITNNSSTDRMFCLANERGKDLISLREARETNDALKCFSMNSFEGRLQARQNYILRFTFTPLKLNSLKKTKHCQTFIKVMEVHYRDGVVGEHDVNVKTFTSVASTAQYLATPVDNLQEFDDIKIPQSEYVRLILYGEMEEAIVTLTPEDFILNDLNISETYSRILIIKNQSKELPLEFRSNIVACVKVEPSKGILGPDKASNIIISITPSGEGRRDYKVIFDLFHKGYKVGSTCLPVKFNASKTYPKVEPTFNMGITPVITHEVGFLVDDIRFNTKTTKPIQAIVDKNHKSFNKNNTDLIAFPNDMPKCLRPWRNKTPCRTIFSNLPRVVCDEDEYTLTAKEAESKQRNLKYYSDYLKTKKSSSTRTIDATSFKFPEYEVTKSSFKLIKTCPDSVGERTFTQHGCIPLPPEKLMQVIIKPKYVYLGKIAPYTTCTESFSIENRNNFNIHVSIKALSNSVIIKEKNRIVIAPKKTRNIFFDCFSHGFGKFYVPVYIIINECHVFDATVFASVVPTTVKCEHKELLINPKTHKSFFELYNPVNCDIRFSWEIQDKNWAITPESGVIPSRKRVFCSVTFIPQINATYRSEIYLLSQSGAKQIITVVCQNDRAVVGFSTVTLRFDNTPLNMKIVKQFVLRNFSDEDIMYLVENPNPLAEISVNPTRGYMNAKSDIIFNVTVLFTEVCSFKCTLDFILQDVYSYSINILGNVVFPAVTITPGNIQIPKVPSGSYQRYSFKIKNTSAAESFITFFLDDISEFKILDLEKKPVTTNINLKADEVKELILEFKPTEPVAYSLFLPYKINDFIGPPILNDSRSIKSESYFTKSNESPLKTPAALPKTIQTLVLRCAATTAWFTFSSLNLSFVYDYKSRCKKRFTITNVSGTAHNFTIQAITGNCPFAMKTEKVLDSESTDALWQFTVEPKETVIFKIEFSPTKYTQCSLELPLYVKKYPLDKPYNYLILTGVYHAPVITSASKLLYFQTILVKEKITRKVTLDLFYHRSDCIIDVRTRHETLIVRPYRRFSFDATPNQPPANSADSADYFIKFGPKKECNINSAITFSCSCGASFNLTIRVAAKNGIFSSYQSFIKARALSEGEKFESTYPFYPLPCNNSFYATTVKVIKEDVERWLFSQGFFYTRFNKLPYGLASFPVNIEPIANGNKVRVKKTPLVLPLVQLLINLVDPNVTKYFDDGTLQPCFEGTQGVMYAYTIYKNILNFLEAQGVFVAQMKPEYLLPYTEYIAYKESVSTENSAPGEDTFSEVDFHYFTKQVWLDLILRIYKAFVYNRATNQFTSPGALRSTSEPEIYRDELIEYFAKHQSEFEEDVSESEVKLMMWLEFHFEKQRHVLWDKEINLQLDGRKIRSFDKDLGDGLPFATLMVAYCPYMQNCFYNFFAKYQNEEDIYHNGCIIYEIWKRLHLSYDLRPIRIVKPNATEMEILVTYLYDVLPNFYPSETITFNASLGEIFLNKIVLKNRGDAVIAYTPLFFLNDTEAFKVDKEIVAIPPGGVNSVVVSYHAKSILKKTAVLVLSGETIGYKFAKTMAFNLVGIPNIFQFTEEYTRRVEVFKQTNMVIKVNSPFENAYEAKLYVFLGDQSKTPESLDEFVSIGWLTTAKVPAQVAMNKECKFNEEGEGVLRLRLCYVGCNTYTYFLYFLNQDVGDFCVKINITATLSEKKCENITVMLPRGFSTDKCICSVRNMDVKCPRMIFIRLPCKNTLLINGLKAMFQNSAEEDEFKFWNSLLDHPKGFYILKEYLENSFEDVIVPFKPLLSQQMKYSIYTRHGKKFTLPQTITIDNVTSSEPLQVKMHWNSYEFPVKELLTFTAEHCQEIRRYSLSFIKSPQSPRSSTRVCQM